MRLIDNDRTVTASPRGLAGLAGSPFRVSIVTWCGRDGERIAGGPQADTATAW